MELINPRSVVGLFASGAAAERKASHWLAAAWARQVRAHLEQKLRYRRARRELYQLEDRELDDLDLARADLAALARRHANGQAPLALS